VVLVCEPHSDAIVMECPQLFYEPVVQLSRPLSREKCDNLLSPARKFSAVPPSRIDRVGKRPSQDRACSSRFQRGEPFEQQFLA
jgi:hypothetical protein